MERCSLISSFYGGGYAPKSAKDRSIEDGSAFDHYFSSPSLSKDCKKKDGQVDDTIRIMQRLIRQKFGQVSALAQDIAVKGADGRLDIYATCNRIFDFVFRYIKYNLEEGEQLQTPRHTWYQAQVLARQHPENPKNSADCDCMSIFCGSMMYALGIPFGLRIAGYSGGDYQHVYCVAYNYDGTPIICDPVMDAFNKEKPPSIQKTISVLSKTSKMALQGTDIYVLDGVDNAPSDKGVNVYSEAGDGSLLLVGTLDGKAKRKEKKAAKQQAKAAKKQAKASKKAAKKPKKAAKILKRAADRAKTLTEKSTKNKAKAEVAKAKKSGDKAAVKTAKEHLKDVKKQVKQAKKEDGRGFIRKAGRAIAKATVKSTLLIPRSAFLLLLRLNFRGISRRLSNNQAAYEKFEKVWKKLGGSASKLKKNIEAGKEKKALFGSKKTKGDSVGQLYELGQVLAGCGCLGNLGSLGDGGATGFAAAVASAAPIIAKVVNVMKEMGENIPETAEEADANGEDVAYGEDDMNISYNEEDISDEGNDYSEYATMTPQYADDGSQYVTNYEEDGGEEMQIEASADDGYTEYEDLDPLTQIDEDTFEYEEYVDALDADEIDDNETPLTMNGYYINGYEDGVIYVDDMAGLNGQLGKGFFKKVFSKVKNTVSNVKSKIQTKKQNKTSANTTKKKQASNTKSRSVTVPQTSTPQYYPQQALAPMQSNTPVEKKSFVKEHPILTATIAAGGLGLIIWGISSLTSSGESRKDNLAGTFRKVAIR